MSAEDRLAKLHALVGAAHLEATLAEDEVVDWCRDAVRKLRLELEYWDRRLTNVRKVHGQRVE